MTVSLQILCFNTVVITAAANRTATKIKTTHCKRLIPFSKENKLTEKVCFFKIIHLQGQTTFHAVKSKSVRYL